MVIEEFMYYSPTSVRYDSKLGTDKIVAYLLLLKEVEWYYICRFLYKICQAMNISII